MGKIIANEGKRSEAEKVAKSKGGEVFATKTGRFVVVKR